MARSRPKLSGLLRAMPALLRWSPTPAGLPGCPDRRMLQMREEQFDLALSRFGGVAPVDEVLRDLDAEIAADRARSRVPRVGRAHHRAHDLPRVLRALDHHRDDRAPAHERDEVVVEALADVLGVVLGEEVGVERAE